MKKTLLCTILSIVMLLSLAICASALGEEMTVAWGTPTIDGTIDDVWASADRQQLGYCKAGDKKVSSTELPEDCTVYASMLYDDTSLYFLFEITDNEFVFESSVGDWKNDSIYLYVDEIGDGDPTWTDQQAQIALIPEDGWEMIPRKGATPAGYELAYTFPTENTCVMEFKYVVRQLAMKEGTEFTVDFQYNDSIAGAARDYCLGWSDESDDASNNSNCWGFATLGAKGASAAAPAAADVPHGNWVSKDFSVSFDDPAWHASASDIDYEDFWVDGETNARAGTYYVYLKGDGKGDFNVEFEVKDSGYYEFAICLMAWQKSVPRATDFRIDNADWIRLEFDYNDEDKELEQFITGLTIWLDKGTHNFTLALPEGFDDSTLKTLYFDYFFYRFLGESAELSSDAAPAPAAPAASGDVLHCNGKEYDEAAAAAKDLGTKPITAYEFVDGSTVYFSSESPDNLWDDDVTTKFCTDGFPAYSVVSTDGKYSINGIIMATANDNSSNPGRAPGDWNIYGSNDGQGWDLIAHGDDQFFTEVSGDVDFTFFAASIDPTPAYSYFKFECLSTAINLMQVSEIVFCSADAPEAAAEEAAPEPEPEPEPEPTTVEEVVENAAENVTEAVENVTEAAGDAVQNAAEAVTDAVDHAKSGCGSFIGGGLIVLLSVLGSAWIAKRK